MPPRPSQKKQGASKKKLKQKIKTFQGAEAIVELHQDKAVKKRILKKYRHPALDKQLRTFRTKREAKVLEALQEKILVPRVIAQEKQKSDEQKTTLTLEKIPGQRLVEVFDSKKTHYTKEIGIILGKMHAENIVHGDLTTSNMIVHEKKGIHLIDFGLSFFSAKEEDKAVDLHLLEKAIEAKHPKDYKKSITRIFREYQLTYKDAPLILKRLEVVRKRGRHKQKNA